MIERTLDATVDLVWQLWVGPEHFAAWYDPEGASIPVAQMDVRVGGRRLVCMQVETPRGAMSMWFTGDMPAGHPTITEIRVELDDLEGSTRMVMTHTGIPPDGATGASRTGTAMARAHRRERGEHDVLAVAPR